MSEARRRRKRNNTIWFAVGSPDERYSTIWRLWTQGSEVYLGTRVILRPGLKVSLHKSGKWRVAWDQRSGIRAPGSKDRVEMRGERPAEWRPGWTQGPAIVVPWTPVINPLSADNFEELETVRWTPPPRPHNKIIFTVLFSGPTASEVDLRTVLGDGDGMIGNLPLTNGQTVWLAGREASMTREEEQHFTIFVADMRVNYEKEPEEFGASLFVVEESPVGVFVIADLSLSKANLRING